VEGGGGVWRKRTSKWIIREVRVRGTGPVVVQRDTLFRRAFLTRTSEICSWFGFCEFRARLTFLFKLTVRRGAASNNTALRLLKINVVCVCVSSLYWSETKHRKVPSGAGCLACPLCGLNIGCSLLHYAPPPVLWSGTAFAECDQRDNHDVCANGRANSWNEKTCAITPEVKKVWGEWTLKCDQ
jgi:hypothetical protein